MFRLRLACLALILWVALPGCRLVQLTSKTTAPTPAREPAASLAAEPFDATLHGRGFYPLEVGNRWRYRRTASQRWVENGVPQTIEYASTLERELVCEPSLAGRTYVSELTREIDGTDVYTSWVHFRQDRTGLYERDERGNPGCAAPDAPIAVPVTTSTLARARLCCPSSPTSGRDDWRAL